MATYAERVREAVDDEEWQSFRKSLKGLDTQSKLNNLKEYYEEFRHTSRREYTHEPEQCYVCIRLDNYLKALARGGQLEKGVSLKQALAWDWCLKVRR